MSEILLQEILKIVSFVPGLLGLASVDVNDSPKPLKESDWSKGVEIEEKGNSQIGIKMAVIIDSELRTSTIINALANAAKSICKQNKVKLDTFFVSVRGVK